MCNITSWKHYSTVEEVIIRKKMISNVQVNVAIVGKEFARRHCRAHVIIQKAVHVMQNQFACTNDFWNMITGVGGLKKIATFGLKKNDILLGFHACAK